MTNSRNFGAAAGDYASHRAGFPDSLFERLAALGIGANGERVADVGAGTGTLGRGFARRGCRVTAIDPDARMLEQGRLLNAGAGVVIDDKVGSAEALPFDDGALDIVAAGQSWHWFDAPAAAREFARVTRPGGYVLIAHFDWLPLPGTAVDATEALIAAHNPAWRMGGGNGIHVASLPHLTAAGFGPFEMFAYDLVVPYTPGAWRGRIRASVGVGASLSAEDVRAFDAALERLLAERFPNPILAIPHRVFALVGVRQVR
ncbi:MAG: class I SAM-dependent methyltransferase [Thermoflexales bacterium]